MFGGSPFGAAPFAAGVKRYVSTGGGSTGQIKANVSGTFVAKPMKWWSGTAWVKKPVKWWNGSAWVPTNY